MKHPWRSLLIALLAVLLASPQTATAQDDAELAAQQAALGLAGLTTEQVEAQPANSSWDGLGLFSEDVTRLLGAAGGPPEGLEEYAFGDDKSVPPVIEPGGARPIAHGQTLFTVPDGWAPPASGLGDTMAFASAAGGAVAPGDEVLFLWTQFDSAYDFADRSLTINEGFPLTVPGLPVWNSTFAGDTWEGANLIPNAVWDGSTLTFDVKSYEPPQSFPLVAIPGFYYRSGDVMAMALHADTLRAYIEGAAPASAEAAASDDAPQTLLYTGDAAAVTTQADDVFGTLLVRYWVHLAAALFTPGYIGLDDVPEYVLVMEFIVATALLLTWALLAPAAPPDPAPEPEPEPDPEPAVDETQEQAQPDDEQQQEPEQQPAQEETEPVEPAVVDDSNTDDGGSGGLLLILLIVILVLAVLLFLWWRSQRTDPEPNHVGGTRVREKKDLHSTPRDATPPVHTDVTHECDWALIFHGDTQTTYLKKPAAGKVECCTYHVKIESAVWLHEQAASFRQDISPARQYIPDVDFGWDGISYHQNASTRSGPAGRQDWQHGGGNPIDQSALDGDSGFWQQGQGEEPPEVATHVMHQEATRVRVWLDAGCPDVEHRFDGRGDGELIRLLTSECTNDAPEESCPVELTAMDLHDSAVFGDIQFSFGTMSGSDIDELERYSEELVALDGDGDAELASPFDPSSINPGRWDGHTHDTSLQTPTLAPGDFHGSEHVVREGTRFAVQFNTFSLCDAAQLVPEAVYDTTERVSSHAGARFDYQLEIEAMTASTGCEGTCKGHPGHACHDAPSFTLRIDSERKQVKVDGLFHYIHRPDMGDRHNPPTPGARRRWELT